MNSTSSQTDYFIAGKSNPHIRERWLFNHILQIHNDNRFIFPLFYIRLSSYQNVIPIL
jgi:hypothetical protein